jgi:hypothetical protein
MKIHVLLLLILMAFSLPAFAQVSDNISNISPIRKGQMILNNGTLISFKHLEVSGDSISIINSQSFTRKYIGSDIYKISKTGNWCLVSAVTCGLSGLLGATLGTSDWDKHPELKDKKSSFILGWTFVSAAAGAIIGAFIEKDKTIYKNSKPLTFNTRLDFIEKNNPAFLLTCNFKF